MTTIAPNFRQLARESLARAKVEVASNNVHRLRYAALELRDAMESLTYDRALAFKKEIPPEDYKTWQPRKLMAVLVDIDPFIGMTSTIAFGFEEEPEKAPARRKIKALGTDHVLTLADLKKHYDALGSFLHMPSLEQVQLGNAPDALKIQARCTTIIGIIEKVLSSRAWNSTLGTVTTLKQCMNEDCKKPIRKRMPTGRDSVEVRCFECEAEYTITLKNDGRALWKSNTIDVSCSTAGCLETMALWPREIKPGAHWRCRGCSTHNKIELCVSKMEDENNKALP